MPLEFPSGDAWTTFRDAQARVAVDEFEALPWLERAYVAFEGARDPIGGDLTARIAVFAIYYADASYVGLNTWIARAQWKRPPPPALDASDLAWWLAGDLVRTYAEATTEYGSDETLVIRNALLRLVGSEAPIAHDAFLVALTTFLEYAEFEDDGLLFDRVVAEALPTLESESGSPLFRGRVWQRIHRCAVALGPVRARGSQRIDAAMAESRALDIADRHALRPLRASLLVARAVYANLSRDESTAQAALLELGRITDFKRSLAAAWYYYLRGQAAARQEDGTEALLLFGQSVDVAATGAAPLGVQQNFINGHAAALVHAGRANEAIERYDCLLTQVSGRDRDIIACRRQIAVYQRAVDADPASAPAQRAALLAQARAIRWLSFGLLTPRSTSRFLADALRDGESPDFIAQVVAQRGLRAEPGYPPTWPWPLRVFTLGTFHIEIDGTPVALGARPQRKPLELLMLLVALGPQPAAISTVLDALWPDADGDRAKHSLEMAVLRARRLLGRDDALIVTAGYVSLDRTQVWVDAWDFAENETLAYVGLFLDGEDGNRAVLGRREQLRALFVQRVVDRGRALEDTGRTTEALALYTDALAQDGLVEALHRGIIRCHVALDEDAAAMREYRRCRERLVDELGVEPSKATRELVAQAGIG